VLWTEQSHLRRTPAGLLNSSREPLESSEFVVSDSEPSMSQSKPQAFLGISKSGGGLERKGTVRACHPFLTQKPCVL
jgi:hypothetical protein